MVFTDRFRFILRLFPHKTVCPNQRDVIATRLFKFPMAATSLHHERICREIIHGEFEAVTSL